MTPAGGATNDGAPGGEVTQLLARWAEGDRGALNALMAVVYSELRRIADAYLRRERTGHTLQPTALVHEAWLRLVQQERPQFEHRRQFFALAAQVMRRILVDHARARQADKRGGGAPTIALTDAIAADGAPIEDLLALDQALDQLAHVSPRQAQIVELRYFAGLTLDELADLLQVSAATICREQKTAEAWLSQAMSRTRP